MMNQIENKNKEQKLFRYLSRESDPRVLAQLLELLKDHGALPFDQLSLALRERGYSLKVDKAKAVRKELEFIEWLLPNTDKWELSISGAIQAATNPVVNISRFSKSLVVAHEIKNSHVITQLLDRMFLINPNERGVIVIPQPILNSLNETIEEIKPSLLNLIQRWNGALKSRMSGFKPLSPSDTIDKIIKDSLSRWDKLSQSQRRSNITKAFADRFLESMFNGLMTPSDVRIWQSRLDWAGITHTGQQLPGVEAHVWFPVGNYFNENEIMSFYEPIHELGQDDKVFCCYLPYGKEFQKRFCEILNEGYLKEQEEEGMEYVSLLSVRDWVCYRLRVSHQVFERTLQELFPKSLRGDLPFTLALEVDITPKEMRDLGRGRPVVIDGTPRYIIAMRMKN